MTLMESSMFTAIQPREFHKLAWRKNDTRKKTSPHIVAVVERFNTVPLLFLLPCTIGQLLTFFAMGVDRRCRTGWHPAS
jgi:hypothetical protein